MFFLLHRIVQGLIVLAIAGIAVWLYFLGWHRPIIVAGRVLLNWESPVEKPQLVSGVVTQVPRDGGIILRDTNQLYYSFRLGGVEVDPAQRMTDNGIEVSNIEYLRQRLISNRVDIVAPFLTPERTGLAIVYHQSTNVNAELIQKGRAPLKTEFIKHWPWIEQYRLFRADQVKEVNRQPDVLTGLN